MLIGNREVGIGNRESADREVDHVATRRREDNRNGRARHFAALIFAPSIRVFRFPIPDVFTRRANTSS
jgi:hypothetical protein